MADAGVARKVVVSEKGLAGLYGPQDRNLKFLERTFQVRIAARGAELSVEGEPGAVDRVAGILSQLSDLAESGYRIQTGDVETAVRLADQDRRASLRQYFTEARVVASSKKQVTPKSFNQRKYLELMRSKDMVFAIGPAGTGKTYLAVAMALAYLSEKRVERMILTRPAVEAGEKLGFLPGDLVAKVDPYLRPLYDAIFDLTQKAHADSLLSHGTIEVAPLAFMRGRTLNDSFVILDEAQNVTSEQMKMFLTRCGFNSKAVITGDITQIDLPTDKTSGLVEVQRVLSSIDEIGFVYFDERDVVRHPLVQSIIKAYEIFENGS
jgi:phosphate starvation-inducible PhoH-like protein